MVGAYDYAGGAERHAAAPAGPASQILRADHQVNAAWNPYHQWLGLDDDIQSPNYYQLLGLAPGESDRGRIHAAADRALARVRGCRPGPRAADWARLLDEIARAKTCLLDPTQRVAYDVQMASGRAGEQTEPSTPPQADAPEVALVNRSPDLYPPGMGPKSPVAARPAAPDASSRPVADQPSRSARDQVRSRALTDTVSPRGEPAKPTRPVSRAAKPPAPPHGQTDEPQLADPSAEMQTGLAVPVAPGPMNAHVAPPRKPPPSSWPIVLTIAVVVVVLTLLVLMLALRGDARGPQGGATGDVPVFEPAATADGSVASPSVRRPAQAKPFAAAGAGSRPVLEGQGSSGEQTARGPQSPAAPDDGAGESLPEDRGAMEDASSAERSAADSRSSVPGASAPSTPVERSAWRGRMERIRAALSLQQFDEADDWLRESQTTAGDAEQLADVARARSLVDGARQYWAAVARGVRGLRGADELEIGDNAFRVAVVETGPDWITIRHQGKNTRYSVDGSMPPGLALAIARTVLEREDPEHLIWMGAGLATTRERKSSYLLEARRYWTEAGDRGADVADLLLLLDESHVAHEQ